jgi:hypothetical protein
MTRSPIARSRSIGFGWVWFRCEFNMREQAMWQARLAQPRHFCDYFGNQLRSEFPRRQIVEDWRKRVRVERTGDRIPAARRF